MDLIDKQSAINKFEPWLKVEGYSEGERNMLKAVIYELRVMPPAQPETATVTRGRTKGETILWYECDACGETVGENDNYCSNCGRKLKHE